MRSVMAFLSFLICLTSVSCNGELTSSVKDAVRVIDRGIQEISANSASWQTALERVAEELPRDISETIRTDAQNLASRSVATAGVEFRCNVDFLANRAIRSLQRLRAALLGEDVSPLPPKVCHTVPDAISLSDAPYRWPKVTFHGYDMDQKDADGNRPQLRLLNSQGGSEPVPEGRIGRTTHYQVTLNLGGLGPILHQRRIEKIQMVWGDQPDSASEVVVAAWQPQRTRELSEPHRTPYMPPLTRGDRDFDTGDDEPMELTLEPQIRITARSIEGRVYMKAAELESDWTTVEGWSNWQPLYSVRQNYRIIDVRPRSTSRYVTRLTQHGRQDYDQPGGEVVQSYEVYGDRNGDEAGVWTRVIVHWRRMDIRIEEMAPDWLR